MSLFIQPILFSIPGIPISGSQLKFNRTTGSAYRPIEHKQRVFTVHEFAENAANKHSSQLKFNRIGKPGFVAGNGTTYIDDNLPLFKQGIPVYMSVIFFFPFRKGDYKTGKNAGVLKNNAPYWTIGNKDIDNLLKPLKDGIKGTIVSDDKQIVEYRSVSKRYNEVAATEIEVGEIE